MHQQDRQNGWSLFVKLCEKAVEKKQLSEVLQLFLTLTEQEEISTRYLIVKDLIEEKKPQRQIAKDAKVSIAKITRGSNQLKTISEKIKKFLLANL